MKSRSMASEILKMWRGGDLDPEGYAEGGEVEPPKRRELPPDEPLGRTMKRDVPLPVGSLPVYQGDAKPSLGADLVKQKRTDFSRFKG